MTTDQLNKAADTITLSLRKVNLIFIKKIAEAVKMTGELRQSDINRLIAMAETGADVNEITNELRKATGVAMRQMVRLFEKAMEDVYTDPRFRAYHNAAKELEAMRHTKGRGEAQRKGTADDKERLQKDAERLKQARKRLEQYTKEITRQTAERISNLSNTTVTGIQYREAIDEAAYAVSTGVTSYSDAIRSTIEKLGGSGIQVEYESGVRRSLEAAVRQNVIDAANQIAQQGSLLMGEELGYDAVELSAHMMSAPDHEPVQGRVFLLAEFEKMQNGESCTDIDGRVYRGFPRSIGQWNCMHIARSFSTKHSKRRYTDEQLEEWRKENEKGCDIGDKHYTLYEVRQLMRGLERKVRAQKKIANAAREAGEEGVRQECQRRINRYSALYKSLSEKANIPMQKDRMQVEGFRMVKVKPRNVAKSTASGKTTTLTSINNETSQEKEEPFVDVTKDWKPEKPYEAKVEENNKSITINDKTYEVDGKNVNYNPSAREKQVAEIISKATGQKVEINPTVSGQFKGVQSPDYYVGEGKEHWDLKGLKGTSKDIVRNAIHKQKKQADNFIIDIINDKNTNEAIIEQAKNVFVADNTKFVQSLVVIKGEDILLALKRK